MTRRTNATVAGVAFLLYIATAMPAMFLSRAAAGPDTAVAAKLTSIAGHPSNVRAAFLLELVGCACALVLAVTLYAITRDVDHDLALLVLVFRTAEGVIGGISLAGALDKLWLATASGPNAPDPTSVKTLGTMLFKLPSAGAMTGAIFFAVASTIFAYLLRRGRLVPVWLAWLGVLGSILILVVYPLQLIGVVTGLFTEVMWLPLLIFEPVLAVWLIVKGVALPARRSA